MNINSKKPITKEDLPVFNTLVLLGREDEERKEENNHMTLMK